MNEVCEYSAVCKFYSATAYNCTHATQERLFCGAFKSLERNVETSPFLKKQPEVGIPVDESDRDHWGKEIFLERYMPENKEGNRP